MMLETLVRRHLEMDRELAGIFLMDGDTDTEERTGADIIMDMREYGLNKKHEGLPYDKLRINVWKQTETEVNLKDIETKVKKRLSDVFFYLEDQGVSWVRWKHTKEMKCGNSVKQDISGLCIVFYAVRFPVTAFQADDKVISAINGWTAGLSEDYFVLGKTEMEQSFVFKTDKPVIYWRIAELDLHQITLSGSFIKCLIIGHCLTAQPLDSVPVVTSITHELSKTGAIQLTDDCNMTLQALSAKCMLKPMAQAAQGQVEAVFQYAVLDDFHDKQKLMNAHFGL